MKIGYARISTEEQSLGLQLDALQAAGCERVFQETASGATPNRAGLARALKACSAGDVLVAWKLDRLGRSTLDLVGLVEKLKAKGVGLKVLTGEGASVDTTRPEGKLIFAVFAAFAEFERELIRERTKAGMLAAKRRGRPIGRPPKLTPAEIETAIRLLAAGRSQRKVAGAVGVAVSTLRDAMKRRRALTVSDDLETGPLKGNPPASISQISNLLT
jgi:DNA invertase Pin-like site-specific DNA recombinase